MTTFLSVSTINHSIPLSIQWDNHSAQHILSLYIQTGLKEEDCPQVFLGLKLQTESISVAASSVTYIVVSVYIDNVDSCVL